MNEPIFQPGVEKPEADYQELARLGRKLGVPVPELFVTLEVTNADGSKGDFYHGRARTWNRLFWNYAFGSLACTPNSSATFGSGTLGFKSTGGTVYAASFNSTAQRNWNYGSATATSTTQKGIVVGTSTAAESFEDFALGAICGVGSGSGQLVHNAQSAPTTSYNAGTKTWTCTHVRVFNNNSAGAIVVAETALYPNEVINNTAMMIERTKLPSTVNVAAGSQLTVTYTVTLTFPA